MSRDHAAELRPVLGRIAGNADLPKSARVAAADAEMAVDVEAVMARTGAAIVALEAAATTAEAAAKELRAALLELMVETGAPSLATATHIISTSEPRKVVITDESLIPPTFMRARDPVPDTQAIRAAMEKGGTCPGATLTNGAPVLTIRARRTS